VRTLFLLKILQPGSPLLFFLTDRIPSLCLQSEVFSDRRGPEWQGDRSSTGFDNICDPQQKFFLNLQEDLCIMS
jgi:hypothetical protein